MIPAAIACLALDGPNPTDAELRRMGLDPARLLAIGRRLDQAVENREIAGAVAILARNGRIAMSRTAGMADIEAGLPMKSDTIFQVMSMTKPFVGVAVVQCAEMGLLSLDDPAERFLPQFRIVQAPDGAPRTRVTLRHLLTHTSGLSGDDPGGLDDDQKRRMTLAEYAALIGTEPLISHPGEAIRYSGVGINALARIVEIVSGQSFEDFAAERIFRPCGMADTAFFLPASKRSRLAKVYGQGLAEFEHDRFRAGARLANGAGGLYSTAHDMAKFMIIFSQKGGGLVSPAGFRALTTVQTGDLLMDGSADRGYGLAFSIIRAPGGAMNLRPAGSFGHTGAFGTDFWYEPSTGLAAVYMSQGFGLGDGLRKAFGAMASASVVEP